MVLFLKGLSMARGRKTSFTIRLTPAQRQTLLAWQRATTISAGRARRVVMKWTRPLCGPASMSQNDFKTSETIPPQEASPMKHHMSVLGIDIAKRVFHGVGM